MLPESDKEKLMIFDTTLRDGEQSPGVSLNVDEKLDIARQLSRLGVDVCEAGFPIASEADFESVQRISREVGALMDGRLSSRPMVMNRYGNAKFMVNFMIRSYVRLPELSKKTFVARTRPSEMHRSIAFILSWRPVIFTWSINYAYHVKNASKKQSMPFALPEASVTMWSLVQRMQVAVIATSCVSY